ncbi:MAG: transporter substrate-binding domain-containing protein [Lachnospiraceae bacterium]|nr:transporter substrate-binding domain-containing protein [Lachnospiraceae bacterium]MDN4742758.1 transporter substrate-binding domain-containing protein [Lachnospiraceae bacterium C1.1]
MKKKIISVLIASAMALSLSACGSATASTASTAAAPSASAETEAASSEAAEAPADGGKLVMATNAEFPPYEYHDSDQIVGIDAEIAAAIAKELGCELEIEDIAFDSIIPEVTSGKADFGMAGMTVTEERKQSVNFSDTYATARQSVIVKEDSDITDIDGLTGKLIGVQTGTTGDLYATDDYGDENIERYSKGMEAVQALAQGKIDAVIIDNEPAKVYVAENEGLKILDTAYAEEEYAICVALDNTELVDKINTALAKLKEDGTIDGIVAKYIKSE